MTDGELIARLRDFKKVTVWDVRDAADRIEQLVATKEALEAKLGYYNLLWQAYEGERPVEHLEEAVKNHSAVSDRLAEQLATCEKYRDAYDEMGRIGTQAVRDLEAKLAKAVEALQYADKMVRLVLIYMTDWDNKDFSQAVFDTEKQIATTLAELEGKE